MPVSSAARRAARAVEPELAVRRERERLSAAVRVRSQPLDEAVGLEAAEPALVALGAQVADPIIGLVITLVILRVTWQSWRTVSTNDPREMVEHHH